MKAVDEPTGVDVTSQRSDDAPQLQLQAAKSFLWAAVSFAGNRVLVFFSTLVLARLLAPDAFGVMAAAMTLILYIEVALDLGVTSALIYEQEDGVSARVHTAFTLNLIVSVILSATGFVAAPAIAAFFRVPDQEAVFRALAGAILLQGAGQVSRAILKRDLRFKALTVVDLVRGGSRAAVAIGLALLGNDVWALVLGYLTGEVAATTAAWMFVGLPLRFRFDRQVGAELLRFGIAVLALKVLGEVAANSDYLVVGNRLGPTSLGYYTMAFRLPEMLLGSVFWVFSSVAFPLYARARAAGAAAFRDAMLQALRLTTLFGFTVGTGIALVAADVVQVVFSSKWDPSAAPMAIIALAFGLNSVGYASGDIFPALGRPGALLKINAALCAVLVAGFVVAAPYGLVAVASVHLGFNVAYAVVRLVVANRLVGSNLSENFFAMRPAIYATGGVLLLALPAHMATERGVFSLVVTTLAGVAGGLGALIVGDRRTLTDVAALARDGFRR
jgi:PST family polysaccharide transporter